MKSTDIMGREIERIRKEMMGHTFLSAEVEAIKKMTELTSSYSTLQIFFDHDSRWKSEIEQFAQSSLPNNSMAHHIAEIENMAGTTAARNAAKHWNETSSLATAASAMNASLGGMASKIASEFETSQHLLGHQLGLSASQKLASSGDVKSVIAGLSGYAAISVAQTLQPDVFAMSNALQASFSLAQIAGTSGIEKAIAASIGSIASQYADQFDVKSRMREMIEGMSTFDLARTAALAKFHGVSGLARQMAALGLEPDEYFDHEDVEELRSKTIGHPQGGLSEISLEVFQQILINLIAAYIWALFLAPTIPNTDLETQNEKLARVESLIEKLPQLIESQVEMIIRRQLFAADSFFVVKERPARLRKAPENGSGVVASAFPNQKLNMLEERGKWIKVEFYDYLAQSMREGWVLKKYCTRISDNRRSSFEEKRPNATTHQAMKQLEAGKGKSFSDVDALMADLHVDD